MLFSQAKAGERPFVVNLPVEPTPTVTMDKRQVPLLEILQELEKQTGVFFSYESSLLDEFPKISFKAQDESLSYCLKRLFFALPVTFRQTGQIVILKRKPRLYTISGFVRDSVSYESLINATVFERMSKSGTATNNYGFYSITLPPGKVTLRASFVGFEVKEITFELTGTFTLGKGIGRGGRGGTESPIGSIEYANRGGGCPGATHQVDAGIAGGDRCGENPATTTRRCSRD